MAVRQGGFMQKLLLRIGAGFALVTLLAAGAGWYALRSSLPAVDGRRAASGLEAAVSIERDARGAVTLNGSRRPDLGFALGFAHAQDRLFQMDLLRRASAGELSALLGPAALGSDRRLRVHRFRAVAAATLAAAPPDQRALLEAYAAGVNAGAASLAVRPFEYLLLRTRPEPWRPEDTVLVALTLFVELQDTDGHAKLQRGLIRAGLPEAAARFVYSAATDWEAALDGSHSDPPAVPGPADYDLRRLGDLDFNPPPRHSRSRAPAGSNNWAVSGARTASGAALIANDQHLGLRVPNIWYRARLRLAAADRAPIDVTGTTLPGAPMVIAGSNGHVAWGFTNSYGDYEDVIIAVPDPSDPSRYLTAAGAHPFTHAPERIEVNGAAPVDLDVVGTQWGPVIGRDSAGRALALEWVAHDPAAINLGLADLESATSLTEALQRASGIGMPAQNFVAGDAAGHIGWTIAGRIPRRKPGDATVPRLSTDPGVGFEGWVAAADYPRIVDPIAGQIATANARVVGGAALATIGDGGYDRGARAGRIQADLAARGSRQTPADMLAVQLDDAAVFLQRWQARLLALLDAPAIAGHPRRAELRAVLGTWSGHAALDDAAYRLVRAVRAEVERRVFYALIAPARAQNPAFRFEPPLTFEGPLWALLEEQPAHLVPPGAANWREFLLVAVDAAVASLDAECPQLSACSWGRANRMRIRHPLSAAVPLLGALLDMPAESLPGDHDMPRVLLPDFGASERFGVSPGHEGEAYFEMPGGQSGHPLSPYFRAGHADWAQGEPAPFLPGPAVHVLTLVP
ncbi:MAG TPA: penicillin acylase family protein [Steroidobacteraceae bacterium]|nr:penicillin acylase family protein [Steroidobacteraceae bacterium]